MAETGTTAQRGAEETRREDREKFLAQPPLVTCTMTTPTSDKPYNTNDKEKKRLELER